MNPTSSLERWPSLPWEEWKDTCDTLHLWTQVVGKVKLTLCPSMNELWQVAFYPTSRGLTTGRIPYGAGAFVVTFDFVDHAIFVSPSDGATRSMQLTARSVAEFYGDFMTLLRDLGVDVRITLLPSEIPDPIRFDQDDAHRAYDPAYARRWWDIMLQVSLILDRYRSSFAGKSSPVLFWWGSFDLNTVRYSGRPAPLMTGVPRFMQLAEDQENMCTGFWPGNPLASGLLIGEPCFYAYCYPEPEGLREVRVRPEAARYDTRVGEFLLPYEEVRRASAPDQAIIEFFTSAYETAAELAKWDSVQKVS